MAKEAAVGTHALTPEERAVFLVNRFLVDLENGGLSGALYNGSEHLQATADSVGAVGDLVSAQVLREAADLLGRASCPTGSTWRQFLATADPDHRVEQWHTQLTSRVGELYAKLEAFTSMHLATWKP
jgi:hypothetical protein